MVSYTCNLMNKHIFFVKDSIRLSDSKEVTMQANLGGVLRRFNKHVTFWTPLQEAIANALEAGATRICVTLYPEELLPNSEVTPKIVEYSVEDNGVGFTPQNRAAFSELYTENKVDLGCKGVGRLTSLCVFENVQIESFTQKERVTLDFNKAFNGISDFQIEERESEETKTIIFFKHLLSAFSSNTDLLDLERCKNRIQSHFLTRLLLMKNESHTVSIVLRDARSATECEISSSTLPSLKERELIIAPCEKPFQLYVGFCEQTKGQFYYCANGRTVCEIKGLADISKCLPDKNQIISLLCGSYLDEAVNDVRDNFIFPTTDENIESLVFPLSLERISQKVIEVVEEEVHKKFPQIEVDNCREIDAAIEEAPYLARYIKNDNSPIKRRDVLIKRANDAFTKEKMEVRKKFEKLLTSKNVNPSTFRKAANEISIIAKEELGEYILYRQAIIDALQQMPSDKAKKEEFLHNLIMPMRTEGRHGVEKTHEASNLWLLDDKFMTYTYAASDKTFKSIMKSLPGQGNVINPLGRPDLLLYFSREVGEEADAIVVELKGANASIDEKLKSIHELPDNIADMRLNLPHIQQVWGYIITQIDARIERTLGRQEYIALFPTNSATKGFYRYYSSPTVNAHITVLDISMIVEDAMARNKTFLDILKGFKRV